MNPVDAYAQSVVSGAVPAGKYHILSCQRHLNDRAREGASGFPYTFQIEHAEKFFHFAKLLKHYKGKQFAGKPIELTPVQQFRLGSIFGWRHAVNGRRRFTTSYNELPRKSGKTLEAAVVALYVTFFEGEPGAEGYCIATKKQQAKLVFDAARQLVKSSGLKGRITAMTHNLHREASQQKLEALGADADSTDGLNPYLIVTDEFHAHKNRALIDVMESATGARLSFLHFQITTAGDDPVSPCGDQHDYICKILDGTLNDDATEATFGFIAHADLEDDWLDEKTWQKANPHWGISVNPEDLRKLALKAKNIPGAVAEFKQKRLNLWVNTHQPCLSMDGWRKGQTSTWKAEDLAHESCYVGIDLASKIDLCAMSVVFPPTVLRSTWRVLQYLWTPEETLIERSRRDKAPYDVWVRQGWLRTTPGTSVNQAVLKETLHELRSQFDVELIGVDPWHADRLIPELIADGFDEKQVLEVPQTFAGMSSGELWFKAEVIAGNIDARGCPVTGWCASNVVEQTDGKDNIFFTKKKSRGRIDPIKSMTIAFNLVKRFGAVETDSVYESRGALVF